MSLRNIIRIDESKCTGCGKCVNACHNSALKLVNGKARLTGETFCDGLGACMGECPVDALTIVQEEVPAYYGHAPAATPAVPKTGCPGTAATSFGGCPGTASRTLKQSPASENSGEAQPSALTHWPIQLKLINPAMPAFRNGDVLLAADCTAFALGGFHGKLLSGRSLIIACPKLDNRDGYVSKLTTLLTEARPKSVTIARMEVPCCTGLVQLMEEAVVAAAYTGPVTEIIVGVEGEILNQRQLNQ